jgi:nucleotide-binding universal stress UspA family protein
MPLRFLLATDLTPASALMLRYTFELNRSFFAQIELLHVFDLPLAAADEEGILLRNHDTLKSTYEQAMWSFVEENRGSYHFDTTVSAVSGGLYQATAERAREWKADLIITGHHIRENLADWGSTGAGKRLTTHPPVPVLSIPDNITLPPRIRKIMICTDLSALPDPKDIRFLRTFIETCRAEASLLHVHVSNEISWQGEQHVIDYWKDTLGTSLLVQEQRKHEPIGQQISTYAESHGIDLIVVFPHQHNWLDRLLLGSQTKWLFEHISLPLLSMPVACDSPGIITES